MAWMLRVVASFGVIEPLQHQLGSSCWWQKLRLKQGRHCLEKLTHFKFLLLTQFHSQHGPVGCAYCFKTGCCFVVDASLLGQRLRNSFFAAETFQPGTLFLKRQ